MATPGTVMVNGIPYPSVRGTAPKTQFVNGTGYSPDTAKIINDQKQRDAIFERGLKSASTSNPVMGEHSNKGGRRRRNRSTKRRNISRRRKLTKRRK